MNTALRDSTAPHSDPGQHNDVAELALYQMPKGLGDFDRAALSQAKANSLLFLRRALTNIVRDELQATVVTHAMYDVLDHLRPRTIATKSGKPYMLFLPASGSGKESPMTVCWHEKGNKELFACDLPRASTFSSHFAGDWGKTCDGLITYKDRMEGVGRVLGLYRSRSDVNVHSLYNTQVMREVFLEEFASRLEQHTNMAELFSRASPTNLWRHTKVHERPQIERDAFEIVMKIANCQVKSAVKSFLREIPDLILDPLWSCGESYIKDIKHAGTGETEQNQIARMRWFLTFPLYRELADREEALSLIDTNQLTEVNIAKICGASAAHIRRLRGLPFSTLAQFGQLGATGLTQILADVNINHIPQSNKASPSEIAPFIAAVVKTVHVARARESTPMAKYTTRNLLKNAAGKWAELNAVATSQELKHASDFIQTFSKRAILPALFRLDQAKNEFANAASDTNHIYDVRRVPAAESTEGKVPLTRTDVINYWQGVSREFLLAALSEKWTLNNILAASKSWHKVVGGSSFKEVFSMWPALCPTLTAPNGVQLVPLTTSAELAEEGRAMHHCVGGYAQTCLSGYSHIFSVRDAKGSRLSTLQLVQRDRSVSIGQNFAVANRAAPTLAAEAGQWLSGEINSGGVKIEWNHLLEQQRLIQKNMGITEALGFNPEDSAVWNKAFCEFKDTCPRHLRADSVEQFVISVLRLLKQKNAPTHPIAANLLYILESDLVEREFLRK